ncbi:melanophilin isoform X16 [Struthio camelus]|uniref:melanophilin isoform X16 n=1 Tax=Struthio camelus TaxID=8801 RepID=UPI003603B2DB
MGRKLDLSKLTDEEAKHVWEVVQRDFDLRKKEEERLEELKCKIDQESSKRAFLTNQGHLNETHCVHCLQPFKFLLNSKRQCLDCRFYTCKNCSRYNKKEQGWVCDPCRSSRIVKIGSLEWYYEHVRSRFKRFGSAKVLQSLYGRLQPGLHDRVYSLPDINSECQLPTSGGTGDDSDDGDDVLRGAEAECYSRIHELNKRMSAIERMLNRLEEKILVRSDESPAPEPQLGPDAEEEELKRKLEELASNISDKGVSSEEEECEEKKKGAKKPEMSSSSDDVASEAQKRSSAQALSDITAKVLKAINATERAVYESLHGESQCSGNCALPGGQLPSPKDGNEVAEAYRELEENVYLTAGKTYRLEKTLKELEEGAQHGGTTDSELSELEDRVASAAAQVQQAESEVSDIESRIAALTAAGLTVKSVEKARKKSSAQGFRLQSPRPASSSPGEHSAESPDDIKAMSGPQVFRRKFNSSLEITGSDDSFDRNSIYRGSLTQRNPNGKNRRVERLFAKPVMTHLP